MRPGISIRGSVRPSVRRSVGPSVRLAFFFKSRKSTYLTSLTNLQIWQIWQIWPISLQFYLSPLLQTHLCSNKLVSVYWVACKRLKKASVISATNHGGPLKVTPRLPIYPRCYNTPLWRNAFRHFRGSIQTFDVRLSLLPAIRWLLSFL